MGVVGEKPLITRMLLLILPLLTLVAAKPDPAGIFDSVQAQGRISEEVSVARMLKESGVATLEKTLENGNDCMAMAMCRHGATKAITKEDAFYVAMKTFTAFLKSVQEASTRSTKQIDSLTGALRVGSAMGEAACRNLYSCPETENLVEGRRGEACVYSAPFCPGFAAGCSMCGIFNPGLCAGLCPVAGLTCGTIGYICNPAITDYNVQEE